MAGDIVKRTLQIIGEGTKLTFKDSFSNLSQLKTDADMIKKEVMNVGSNASETYRNIRNGKLTRSVSDWFYGKSEEFGFEEDEFDPGFKIDNADDEDHSGPSVLDADAMRSVTDRQTNTLVQAAQKQAEQSVINTAEIVSSFNSRSSETLAAIKTINENLSNIAKKIDTLIEAQKGILEIQSTTGSDYGSKNPLFNDNGQVTLGSFFNNAKGAAGDSFFGTVLKYASDAKQIGPEDLFSLGLGLLSDKKFNKLGGQSVNDITKRINEGIGAAIHTGLTEVMHSDLFKKFFGDKMTTKSGSPDYAQYRKGDKYDREQAVFDNMTRRTITHIIPEYLKKITESVSGKSFHIDDTGSLTDKDLKDNFNSVLDPIKYTGGINSRTVKRIQKEKNFPDEDISHAYELLTIVFTGYLQDSTSRQIRQSELLQHPDLIRQASKLLIQIHGKTINYWNDVCVVVLGQLSSSIAGASFCTNITKTISQIDKNAIDYMSSGLPSANAVKDTTITGKRIVDAAVNAMKDGSNGGGSNNNDSDSSPIIDSSTGKNGSITARSYEKLVSIDKSTTAIMRLLRYGINVRVQNGQLPPVGPGAGPGTTGNGNLLSSLFGNGDTVPTNDKIAERLAEMNANAPITKAVNAASGAVNKVQNVMSGIIGVSTPNGRSGGILQNLTDSVTGRLNSFIDNRRNNKLTNDIKSGKGISAEDQQQAQMVLSMMQTATADGDTSEDIQAITAEIDKIKDSKLRSRLSSAIPSMLKRSGSDDKSSSSGGGGGLLSLLGKGFKLAILPIKAMLSKGFNLIKKFGISAIKFLGKVLKSSFKRITIGIKNVVSGFAGLGKKLLSVPKNLFTMFKNSKFVKWVKTTGTKLSDVVKKGFSLVKTKLSNIASKVSDGLKNVLGKIKLPSLGGNKKEKEKDPNKKPGLLGQFAQGFSKSFTEYKESKNKKQPTTYADEKSGSMADMMEGKKNSILSKMSDIFTTISTDVKSLLGIEEQSSEEEKSSEKEKKSTTAELTTDSDVTEASGGGKSKKSKAGGEKTGIMGELGKIFGGFTSILMGIGQAVIAVVAGMEGFKELTNIGKEILTKGLAPLNKAFKDIKKAIEPIVEIVTQIVEVIAETITEIAESLIDVIQPLIEVIQPIMESIFEFMEPLLDMITTMLTIQLAPMLAYIEFAIVPILNVVADVLQITLGVIQIFMGSVLAGIGGILGAIGKVISIFGNDSLSDKAADMREQGASQVKAGWNAVKTGTVKLAKDAIDMANPFPELVGAITGKDEEPEEKAAVKSNQDPYLSKGSAMEGAYGNGNVYNINNWYGSGNSTNQHTYGSYMNMDKRGCGPVALADAFNRRTGMSISPLALVGNGNMLDPDRGTSVGSFMAMSSALGMGVTAAGVTADSLRRATPNNPVTVLGSGVGYGTGDGNNHYVNVLGSDSYGGTYISNPLSGRVERRPTSAVVGGAKLGLYGSGDDNDGIITLNEEAQAAFDELKNLVFQLKDLFTPKQSTEEKIKEKTDEVAAKISASNAAKLDADQLKEVEDKAFEMFKSHNYQHSNENDEQYKARYEKEKNKWIALAMNELGYDQDAYGKDILEAATIATSEDEGGLLHTFGNIYDGISQSGASSSGNGGNGAFISDGGVVLALDGAASRFTDVDMKDYNTKYTDLYIHSPLHEFFRITSQSEAAGSNEGKWWGQRNAGDRFGHGSQGLDHPGLDIAFRAVSEGKSLYPTTDGTVTDVNIMHSSMGNSVEWKDSAGYLHRYMHMQSAPMVTNDQTIIGGKTLLGYVGNTGDSRGAHLHYQINGSDGTVNPLTYFNYNPYYASNLVGDSNAEQIWWYLLDNGFTKEGAAAVMGNMEHESSMDPRNAQDSYSYLYGTDDDYNAKLDDRSYSRSEFSNDQVGYGLVQWTASDRKDKLYGHMLNYPAFGDMAGQLGYFMQEIGGYGSVYNLLKGNDLNAASKEFMQKFENPKDQSSEAINNRYQTGLKWYNTFKDKPHPAVPVATTDVANSEFTDIFNMFDEYGTDFHIGNVKNDDTRPMRVWGTKDTSTEVLDHVPAGAQIYYKPHDEWVDIRYYDPQQNKVIKGWSLLSAINDAYTSSQYDAAIKQYGTSTGTNNKTSTGTTFSSVNSEWDAKVNKYGIEAAEMEARINHNNIELGYTYPDGRPINVSGETSNLNNISYNEFLATELQSILKGQSSMNFNDIFGQIYHRDPSSFEKFFYKNYLTDPNAILTSAQWDQYKKNEISGMRNSGSILLNQDALEWIRLHGGGDELPPLDTSKLLDNDSSQYSGLGSIINNYNIQPDYASKKAEIYERIMKNTYNVRAERVEELLEQIIERLDNKPNPKPTNDHSNLFPNNDIPAQVTRLSK